MFRLKARGVAVAEPLVFNFIIPHRPVTDQDMDFLPKYPAIVEIKSFSRISSTYERIQDLKYQFSMHDSVAAKYSGLPAGTPRPLLDCNE